MFFDRDIKGDRLPPRTLCLTYDDGPGATDGDRAGPHTEELARYLHAEGIAATFFAVGRHAEPHRELLAKLRGWGHLVGNHTYDHPGLVALAQAGGDVVGEITRTHEVIRESAGEDVVYLRAPYGNWRETARAVGGEDEPTSVIAEILNRSDELRSYVGPINWDIAAGDWTFWERGEGAEECADAYLAKIEQVGRGIVLMHDSSEDPDARARNRTMEATKRLVPALKARGYRFIRLDAVPQVVSAARVKDQVALRSIDGRYVSLGTDGESLAAEGPFVGGGEAFGVVELGEDHLALRASRGLYVSVDPRSGEVRATGLLPGTWETLLREDLGGGRIRLRTPDGRYLSADPDEGGRLFATPSRRDDGAVLRLSRRFA